MDPDIFRKFSDNLKKILILAERIAKDSGRLMDSEDMLSALTLTRGTLANDILSNFEVTSDRVQIVAKLVSSQSKKTQVVGISEDAKKVIQSAVKVAADYNHFIVDAEHLLLSLVSDSRLNSYSIVERIGANPGKIKEQLETIFNEISKAAGGPGEIFNTGADRQNLEGLPGGENFTEGAFQEAASRTTTKDAGKSFIEQYTLNLTRLAQDNKLDPLIGRGVEIERVSQILCRRTKNNPLLIGEPGVGKTAIVEGLAKKIIEGSVPPVLVGKTIFSLDLGALLAGTMYRGQFESRVKKLLSEIKKAGNVILFIDELHTTIGTGSAEGSLDTANMLKPILSRGEFKIIGATTYDEYKKYLEKDPAYERRFQVVQVNEPTPEETYKILRGLRSRYEEHHGVKFTPDALHAAVEFSHRYISDRYLPDKAIDLIDEAAAATNIVTSLGAKVAKLKSKLADMLAKKEDAVTAENYEAATQLREEEIKLTDRITALEGELIAGKEKVIDAADIARVVSRWTGVNVENLSLDERKRFLNLETRLKRYIIGQDEAVKAIAKSIRRSRAGVADPRRPIGSYLFLGPTGVGKTHLSKKLAEILFGSEDSLIKIDMSEFMEKHNVSRLVGAPAGYVGYDDGGKLTEAVRHKPYSIILFDEIEKAHPEVFNILLQILEDGYLTDAKGRRINFRNTIVILTSNLGTLELNKVAAIGFSANAGGKKDFEKKYESLKERVMEIVNKELRPEFINRLDSIIVFRPLDKTSVERIVELNLVELSKRLKKQGIILSVTKDVKKFIAETGFSEEFGARPIRRAISENLEDPISEAIIAGKYSSGDKISVHLVNGKIVFRK